MSPEAEAPKDCPLCPRLVAYRRRNAAEEPFWFNGAAPSFGDPKAALLIVGLAPGRTGANRTGRPFTGDYAGELLYGTLLKFGLASGQYRADPEDGLRLSGCMITNAVRCAPPENKPSPAEIAECRPFLAARIAALPHLKAILALGRIAHDSVLRAYGLKPTAAAFAHEAVFSLPSGGFSPDAPRPGAVLVASYHCSRYNTQTGRLTTLMFERAVAAAKAAAGL
jgi:uracil-DNA glycosylase family 4